MKHRKQSSTLSPAFAHEAAFAREAEPQTNEEKKALERIIESVSLVDRQDVRTHLLAFLEVIRMQVACSALLASPRDRHSMWAKKMQRAVQALEEALSTSPPRSLAQVVPGESWGEFFMAGRSAIKQLEKILAESKRVALAKDRRPPKHSQRLETSMICELMGFVREETGNPHLRDLALLLMRPCNDQGVTAERLKSLLAYHKPRN